MKSLWSLITVIKEGYIKGATFDQRHVKYKDMSHENIWKRAFWADGATK